MHNSRVLSRHPLIKFIGKRSWPSTPERSHAHPAAPLELKQRFDEIFNRSSSSSSSNKSKPLPQGVLDFMDAPTRFTIPKTLEEAEIEAIMTGGASLH